MASDDSGFRAAVLRVLLAERRKQAKMTQAQLAKKLGWDQSTVSMLENGQRRIEVIEFIEIAEAIGFDPGELLKTVSTVKK